MQCSEECSVVWQEIRERKKVFYRVLSTTNGMHNVRKIATHARICAQTMIFERIGATRVHMSMWKRGERSNHAGHKSKSKPPIHLHLV